VNHHLIYKKIVRRVNLECIFLLCLVFLLLRPVLKRFWRKPIWLISEKENEARDNGYEFFKYVQSVNTGRDVFYVITRDSYDLEKVQGCNFVFYRSLKHFLLFSVSECLIASQMHTGIPYSYVDRTVWLKKLSSKLKIVFLQHGVTKDSYKLFTRARTQIDLFICAGKPEYDYLRLHAGYCAGNGALALTGFPRFDSYVFNRQDGIRSIFVFPTFRKWLVSADQQSGYETSFSFEQSKFFKFYDNFLKNPMLTEFLETTGTQCNFYLHYAMQSYSKKFKVDSKQVKIIDPKSTDIRDLILYSDLLITDRSSLAFDFAYMLKPVIYVDFDSKEFEQYHYKPGYFDYRKDGFGPVHQDPKCVVNAILELAINNGRMTAPYISRAKDFFPIQDHNNSERVYDAIIKFLKDCDT